MKTTVALTLGSRITVSPLDGGRVRLSLQYRGGHQGGEWMESEGVTITQDQAGALIFGLEQAAEAARIAQERASLTA